MQSRALHCDLRCCIHCPLLRTPNRYLIVSAAAALPQRCRSAAAALPQRCFTARTHCGLAKPLGSPRVPPSAPPSLCLTLPLHVCAHPSFPPSPLTATMYSATPSDAFRSQRAPRVPPRVPVEPISRFAAANAPCGCDWPPTHSGGHDGRSAQGRDQHQQVAADTRSRHQKSRGDLQQRRRRKR
jgi:hypothetical protein